MKIPEYDQIIRELSKLRYKQGLSKTSLVNYLKDEYGLKDSRAYELVRDMMAATAKAYHEMNQDALSDSVEYLEELRQKAIKDGDTKLSLEISKEIHKVSKLYIEQIEMNLKAEVPLFGPEPNKEDKKKK